MTQTIKDAEKNHWVYRMPESWQPYLQLARYDRPIGYWLLALPGWIALAFASLSFPLNKWTDLKWAALILIGAIAMRGAGCTYNDIVDRDLDARVERTALRPIPAGTISLKQAWIWLGVQCFIGLMVLLCLPRLAQIISLCAIPLVAAYPFMKRITWWPQVWLGLTFNWAALVAYAAKMRELNSDIGLLYAGLIFWTIGYDTIYACQDIEDDAFVGIKSTARRFGKHVKLGVGASYGIFAIIIIYLTFNASEIYITPSEWYIMPAWVLPLFLLPFLIHLFWQTVQLDAKNNESSLKLFKSNWLAAIFLIGGIICLQLKTRSAYIPEFTPPKIETLTPM